VTKAVVALSGGIGGAKLATGLAQSGNAVNLAIIANTGDDFEHFGLKVCPDIDTLIYTLARVNNSETGWGREGETWSFMSAMSELGGDTWFQLGDKDLAQNVLRTAQLQNGKSLSEVSKYLAAQLGVTAQVIPMSDASVSTTIVSADGVLEFQQYFVRDQCRPVVTDIVFRGIESARPSPEFCRLMDSDDVAAFIICPSNPYLSIDPILSLAGVRDGLRKNKAPVIAVSPIVSGDSLKGPTAKIMAELGVPCSATQVAEHYKGLIDGLVIDERDEDLVEEIASSGIAVKTAATIMRTAEDRIDLANVVLEFAKTLA
jgi:LPPG:FO 2-phospho-L-lactate transferase